MKEENNIRFDKFAKMGKCEVCGKMDKIVVVSSALGAVSNAICRDCLSKGLEPISNIAGYLLFNGIYSYEELKESKLEYDFVTEQMEKRDASDDDWNILWKTVKHSKEILTKIDEEDEG